MTTTNNNSKTINTSYWLRSDTNNSNSNHNYNINNKIIHKLYSDTELPQFDPDDTTEICKYIKYYDDHGNCRADIVESWCKTDRKLYMDPKSHPKANTMMSCNICDNYGIHGNRCGRCGADSGSYFVGQKLSEDECAEADERMRLEDLDAGTHDTFKNTIAGLRKVVIIDLRGTEHE